MSVVTFGEAMIAMVPTTPGPLRSVHTFEKHVGGAELNTAIGLCRLGTPARWISRVGEDEFGAEILRTARAEGVDVSRVRTDPDLPTAVYFREYGGPAGIRVAYYRSGSAASRLCADDVDRDALAGARLLFLTGITPALGVPCRDLCRRAVGLARELGVPVAIDLNIRRSLLPRGEAPGLLVPLVEAADVLLASEDELEELFGSGPSFAVDPSGVAAPLSGGTPAARAARLGPLLERARSRGPGVVACKLGPDGAAALAADGLVVQPALPVSHVVDPIGAGDGFDAGFLHVWLRGAAVAEALRWGVVVGACAVAVRGDSDGYPDAAGAAALVARLAADRPADVER